MEEINSNSSLVYLSLGSNLGDRFQNLQSAIDLIKKEGCEVLSISSIYETPPLGFVTDDYFYNICISIKTLFNPEGLLDKLLEIEQVLGRTKKTNINIETPIYSSRIIDIDIIFFDQLISKTDKLSIPHPLFTQRKFVLVPLNEIASNYREPVSKLKINELLAICKDTSVLHRTRFKLLS